PLAGTPCPPRCGSVRKARRAWRRAAGGGPAGVARPRRALGRHPPSSISTSANRFVKFSGWGHGGRMNDSYDVVVVGGGAAGLSGAVAPARSRRSVLVIGAGDPRNAPASHVHNFLTRDGAPPAEIYAAGRGEVARYGGRGETGGGPPPD